MKPQIDPATTGITFVDILFALAVGVALDPVAKWATHPKLNPLPRGNAMNLGVAIVVILTSFIGYHNSVNRPRFKIRFVNIQLIKFLLDILMVAVYFAIAAFAAKKPAVARPETVLVAVTFLLYVLWDLTGWYEKGRSVYKIAWLAARKDQNRPDVQDPWYKTNYWRILPTLSGLLLSSLLAAWTWGLQRPITFKNLAWCDGLLFAILLIYRVVKDNMPTGERVES